MNISYYKKYEPIDGKWYITKELGSGSFGTVFEIQRKKFPEMKSALKIISIPNSQNEVRSYREENYDLDDRGVTSYFYGVVEEFIKEFKLMSQLKGNSNIVSYEDHDIKKHENDIGWDILIRMELLTPLGKYLADNKPDQNTVIKLGIDMCKALEVCQKHNIIHRDIKPSNIFVSDNGDFKLGDFGVARTLEKTSSGLSKKGTYTYMAPEVFRGESYGASVDTYSLGIVMYKLLNNNLEPFRKGRTYSDSEAASELRMKGEKMLAPPNADANLAKVILKACSYNPADRYSDPTQMRNELEKINYTKIENNSTKTDDYRSDDKQNTQTEDIQGTISMFSKSEEADETENMFVAVDSLKAADEVEYKTKTNTDVFISYSSKDTHTANSVCKALESVGIKCFIASRDIKVGSNWAKLINAAIENSKAFVLIFSENSNNSAHVVKELNLAINNRLVILTFKIDKTIPRSSMKYYLSDTQWLDAANGNTVKNINLLKEAVLVHLSKLEKEPPKTEKRKLKKRYIIVPFVVLFAVISCITASKVLLKSKNESADNIDSVTVNESDYAEMEYIVPDAIGNFSEGLACIIKDNKYGYINKEGEIVIPIEFEVDPESQEVHSFMNEAALFHNGMARVCKNGKYGYIDKTGNVVIPCTYDYCGEFFGDKTIADKCIIDKTGKKLADISDYDYVSDCFDDRIWVRNENENWGCVDENGAVVIPFIYAHAHDFSEGMAWVCKEEGGKWGCIDNNGTEVIPFIYSNADDFSEGLAVAVLGKKHGVINKKGDTVVPFEYDSGHVKFSDGYIVMRKEYKGQDIIDKKGNITGTSNNVDYLGDFSEDLCAFYDSDSGKYGYFDKNLNVKIPAEYDYTGGFSEELAWVENGEKCYYIDKNGSIALDKFFMKAKKSDENIGSKFMGVWYYTGLSDPQYADDFGRIEIEPYGENKAKVFWDDGTENIFEIVSEDRGEGPYRGNEKVIYYVDTEDGKEHFGITVAEGGTIFQPGAGGYRTVPDGYEKKSAKKKKEFEARFEELSKREITSASQQEMNIESKGIYDEWERLLNEMFNCLQETMSKNEFAVLQKDELEWVAQKGNAISIAGKEYEGGSMAPLARNSVGIEYTKERCEYLLSLIK